MQNENKVVIVTGAASGIGKAAALWFANDGYSVVIADLDKDGGEEVATQIVSQGQDSIALHTDISSVDQIRDLVDKTIERYGHIDSLVNNAANLSLNFSDTNIIDTDIEIFEQVFQANLRSVFAASKFVLPHMLERKTGTIVNISSVQSLLGDMERISYSASKAGINSLTRSIATTYGKQGIRCNTICPGPVMNREAGKTWPVAVQEQFAEHVLTPDLGAPDEIAEIIGFLASDRSSFITGETIIADGGMTLNMPLHLKIADLLK